MNEDSDAMVITKDIVYAIKAVQALSDSNIKTLKEISEKQKIPASFTYKILKDLSCAKIVRSSRGPMGGYRLLKKPEDISLFCIISSIKGDLSIEQRFNLTSLCPCDSNGDGCPVHRDFEYLQAEVILSLKNNTIDKLSNHCPA